MNILKRFLNQSPSNCLTRQPALSSPAIKHTTTYSTRDTQSLPYASASTSQMYPHQDMFGWWRQKHKNPADLLMLDLFVLIELATVIE